MSNLQRLELLIFPEPWSYGDTGYFYRECFPAFAKTLLQGCCGLSNLTPEEYLNRMKRSYRDMLLTIGAGSISTPIHFPTSNSVFDSTQQKLSVHIKNLQQLCTVEITDDIAGDIYEHIVSKIERPDVLELIRCCIKDAVLEGGIREQIAEFVGEHYSQLEELSKTNQLAQWCLEEFDDPKFAR